MTIQFAGVSRLTSLTAAKFSPGQPVLKVSYAIAADKTIHDIAFEDHLIASVRPHMLMTDSTGARVPLEMATTNNVLDCVDTLELRNGQTYHVGEAINPAETKWLLFDFRDALGKVFDRKQGKENPARKGMFFMPADLEASRNLIQRLPKSLSAAITEHIGQNRI